MKQFVPLSSRITLRVFISSGLALVGLVIVSTRATHTTRSAPIDTGLRKVNLPASPLVATTLTVNSLGDAADASVGNGVCDTDLGTSGDQCTLRAAIQEANALFSADAIDFSVTGTINLTGALPTLASDMTITGPGSALLTVRRDTGGIYRIFTISTGTIAISGMTITNGRTADGVLGQGNNVGPSGGGILQSSGKLTLTDVVLTGNTTGKGYDDLSSGNSIGGLGGFGGGIDAAGTLIMTNCVVSNNTTGRGGDGGLPGAGGRGAGIFLEAQARATLNNVTVTGNVTGIGGGPGNSTRSGDGAGIWTGGSGFQATATLDMTNCVITNNSTADSLRYSGGGGGLYIIAGTVTLIDSIVTNNRTGNGSTSNGSAGSGAGILNNGTLTVSGSTISGNSTGNGSFGSDTNVGGGINNNFILKMINSTVSGNSTGAGSTLGGGIYSGNFLSLTNCTITGNNDSNNHHGVTATNTVNMRNTIIARNGPGGAGPDFDSGFFTLTLNSQGHNIIGNAGSITGFTGPGDQVGVDPLLGPLANNGGKTFTHALLSSSPALDAGDNCVTDVAHCGDANIPQLTTDQRGSGFSRIVDGPDANATATVDIGAYEKQAVFPNLADATTNEDTQLIIAFDLDDIASVTSVTATSSNSTLVPNNAANISVVLAGSTAVLTINPAANLSGITDITVTVNRTSGSANDTFALTVIAVNDAPSFTKGPDHSVNENDPAQTVNNWATAISAGPADESGQTVTFHIVSNSNASLFSVAPAISSNGTLTYTPATGVSGTALITIRLSDNGGTANGGSDTSSTQTFNINVLDGGALQFSSFSYSVSESGGSALITVSRFGGSAGEARINYATSNGTATAGQDYTSVSGTLTFANGVTSQTFSVPILGDNFDESDNESVTLTLSNPAGSGSLGFPSTSTLNINDDDPRPTVSINDVQLLEGNSGTSDAVFTVTLTGQTAQQVTVGFATSNNSATLSDYQPTSGQLTFNPGETTKTITVLVVGDTLGESNETFFVNLTFSTNANISRFRGTGTIFNDDTSTQFSSATYAVNEGMVSASITVNRTGNTTGSSTVQYTTSDSAGSAACSAVTGNASEKCDYVSTSGTLSFAPGETSKTFVISFVDDGWLEGNESFIVTLTSPAGATLGSPNSATVTIADNDLAGTVPVLFAENGTNYAVALNSVTFVRAPFRVVDPYNFTTDRRTRVMLFTSNLKLTQPDPGYLSVQASGVDLPIEKVGLVTGVAGLDASYLIVRLPDNLPSGDLQLTVTLRGSISNASILQIVP